MSTLTYLVNHILIGREKKTTTLRDNTELNLNMLLQSKCMSMVIEITCTKKKLDRFGF